MKSEVAVKVGESRLISSREYFLWTFLILHLSRQWTISKEKIPDGSCDLSIRLHVVCVQLGEHRQMNRETTVNDIRLVHLPHRTCCP